MNIAWMWRLVIGLHTVPLILAFPDGAPVEACPNMMPLHQGLQPSSTPAPFIVKVDQTTVAPGQTITVTLESLPQKYRYFQGFLIVAVSSNNFLEKVGSFATNEEKYVACGSNAYSAVTHSSRRKKSSVLLRWTPPADYEGSVIFVVTFVENFSTFWVAQQSSAIKIAAGPMYHTILPVVPDPALIYHTANSNTVENQSGTKSQQLVEKDDIYAGCEVTKGCFGEPAGCIKSKSCDMIVSFRRVKNDIRFQLLGPAKGWIAVGLSKDSSMGEDSVIECVQDQQTGVANIFTSFNRPGYTNSRLELPQEGLSDMLSHVIDHQIFCSFTRQGRMAVHGINYDLLHDPHYLFLASGLLRPRTPDQLQKHASIPYRSKSAVDLTAVSDIVGMSDTLIFAHGCLMVLAWIGTANLAAFFARFYKYTWMETTYCGEKVWFVWHRSLNIITIVLTSISVICIFSHVQGWSSVSKENAHPVLGIIAVVFMWLQPIMAAFRPHPGTPTRPIFNWAHFLVGNAARLFALSTLFLAQKLEKASLPMSYTGVLVGFVIYEALSIFIMEGYSCIKARDGRDQIPLKELPQPINHSETPQTQKSKDAPGSRFRKTVLIVYIVGLVILIFTLLLIITMSSVQVPVQ